MISKNDAGIIIPAYNESGSIKKVILDSLNFGEVIVVNDGSNDKTKYISESNGALVISHSFNKGYDQSILTGLDQAKKMGLKYVVTIDADGQHNSKDLHQVLKMLKNDNLDLVIGIRERPARISEFLFNLYVRFKYGVSDILCGLKGYNLKQNKEINFLKKAENSVGTEISLIYLRRKLKIGELPIQTNRRNGNSKYGSFLKSNFLIMLALFKLIKYDLFNDSVSKKYD